MDSMQDITEKLKSTSIKDKDKDNEPKTRLTLMGMPTEILEQIIDAIQPESLSLALENNVAERDGMWRCKWNPTWLPNLRLISHAIKHLAEPIIARKLDVFVTEANRGKAIDSIEIKSDTPPEIKLHLDMVPSWIAQDLRALYIWQSKVNSGMVSDRIDVSAFPKLLELRFFIGDFGYLIHSLLDYAAQSDMCAIKEFWNMEFMVDNITRCFEHFFELQPWELQLKRAEWARRKRVLNCNSLRMSLLAMFGLFQNCYFGVGRVR